VIFETLSSFYVLLPTLCGEVFLLSIAHMLSAVHLVAETLVSESGINVIYTVLTDFYVHMTAHRNKFIYNKTNYMH
jgi:hypothetical protein